MNFGIFYDGRPQTACNNNASLPGDPPTGQMYGGFYVDQGPAGYHNSALYSDPRIAIYLGMGMHQMPGDVWWRSWRTPPPRLCPTDPDDSTQGQFPDPGQWQVYTDPQSGKQFNVWEGHYVYPGTSLKFVPTFAGGMFEGLMANLVVPETTWGTHSFGLNDVRWAQVQQRYATQVLHFPVWGLSPSSTADDTGGYGGFGVEGLAFPAGQGLSQCTTCATEDTVSPHASVDRPAGASPRPTRTSSAARRYPGVYSADGGFYDAVNPVTGVGRPPPPGARPVDDHGRARQRTERRRDAALLRARPAVVGGASVPVGRDDVDRLSAAPRRSRRARRCWAAATGISSLSLVKRFPSTSPIATSCSPMPRMSSISRLRSRQIASALRARSRLRVSAVSSISSDSPRAVVRSSSASRWAAARCCWLSRRAASRVSSASRCAASLVS